jgi:hypothetical protein
LVKYLRMIAGLAVAALLLAPNGTAMGADADGIR